MDHLSDSTVDCRSVFIWLLLLLTPQIGYDDLALKRCSPALDWTIHGWWPEINATQWPQYCNPNRFHEFNQTIIKDIGPILKRYWAPCKDWHIPDYKFWQHEWRKHGTCTNQTALRYFSSTIAKFMALPTKYVDNCCGDGAQNCKIHFRGDRYWC